MKKALSLLIILSSIYFSSCKKKETQVDTAQNNLITKIIKPEGGTYDFIDGIAIIVPNNSVLTNTELTIGYTGKETNSISNSNMKVIGKSFTFKFASDTLYDDIEIKIPKPNGYTYLNKTSIVASVNPIIPLFLREEGNFLIAKFDNLVIQKYKSVRPGELIKDLVIEVIIDAHLPMDNEIGLKEVSIDNNGKMVFTDLAGITSSDKVLVMVHGWTGSPASTWTDFFKNIKPLILQSGYTKFATFGYFSSLPINNNGALLANQIQTKLNGAKLDIVAHSMGGLVSRSAIENHNSAGLVKNLITLGTPHKGAPAANWRDLIGGLFKVNTVLNQSYDINTQGFQNLQDTSTFITQLNKNPLPITNYYPIAAVGINQGTPTTSDPIVFKESALGIQGNSNGAIGRIFPIYNIVPHTAMLNDNLVLNHVADKLNEFNPQIPTADLIAYYPFNGTTNDISGNNNNGNINGGIVYSNDRFNVPNKACSFNGSDAYIVVPPSLTINSITKTTDATFTCWFKTDSWNNIGGHISKNNNSNDLHYRFLVNETSTLLQVEQPYEYARYPALQVNQWYHFAAVKSGNIAKFYIDGNLVNSTPMIDDFWASDFNTNLEIGRDAHGNIEYTKGVFDEIRIYKRALTSAEINAIKNN